MTRRRGPQDHEPASSRPATGEHDDDTAESAARERVGDLLERMNRVDLQVIVVAPPGAIRLAAEDRARDAALVAGRDGLLRDATAAAREATVTLFARAGFSGTWALTRTSVSAATSGDRVAAASAFEEAAMAAVVEDLVDADTLDVLRSTADQFERFGGLPLPGSLATIGSPGASTLGGPIRSAVIAVFIVFCLVAGLSIGSVTGLVLVVFGIAVVTAMARRLGQPDP